MNLYALGSNLIFRFAAEQRTPVKVFVDPFFFFFFFCRPEAMDMKVHYLCLCMITRLTSDPNMCWTLVGLTHDPESRAWLTPLLPG